MSFTCVSSWLSCPDSDHDRHEQVASENVKVGAMKFQTGVLQGVP